jgi:hypothetical protein
MKIGFILNLYLSNLDKLLFIYNTITFIKVTIHTCETFLVVLLAGLYR